MPAPGDQYHGGDVHNPFQARVSQFTAQEIATLQSRLSKQLGPEWITQRPGSGGGKIAYLQGNKAIAIANEVFGFNNWSSSLGSVTVDFLDENPHNGKVNLGISIVVRVTLKDGTYHEDIGYGCIENAKTKAMAFEKAKKEAATDGLKRALRTFGNVLGNCLYNQEYLKEVQKIKVKPLKVEEKNLYRHQEYVSPEEKEGRTVVKKEPRQTPVRPDPIDRTHIEQLGESIIGEFDDDYDDNLFDGVEIPVAADEPQSFEPQTPVQQRNAMRSDPKRAPMAPPTVGNQGVPRLQGPTNQAYQTAQRAQDQNQSNRSNPPQAHQQQQPRPGAPGGGLPPTAVNPGQNHRSTTPQPLQPQPANPSAQGSGTAASTANPPQNHKPPIGFVTSRAAELMQNSEAIGNLPAFNPHADSPLPKEQRTPGIDHARSAPVKRQAVNAPGPPAAQNGNNSQPRPVKNFMQPWLDPGRKVGMPASPSMNRGGYKPPMKRPPLQDLSNQGRNATLPGPPDPKRQKMEAPEVRNQPPGEVKD